MNAEYEDNDEEWEEEEQLVVVHLSGIIDMDYLKKCDASNCKVLGIDTDGPAIQIDKMCFHGTYDESIGTNIIFEEQSTVGTELVNGKVPKNFKYMCHTTKNLDMIRVFLSNTKGGGEAGEKSGEVATVQDTDMEQTQETTDPHENTSSEMLEQTGHCYHEGVNSARTASG